MEQKIPRKYKDIRINSGAQKNKPPEEIEKNGKKGGIATMFDLASDVFGLKERETIDRAISLVLDQMDKLDEVMEQYSLTRRKLVGNCKFLKSQEIPINDRLDLARKIINTYSQND